MGDRFNDFTGGALRVDVADDGLPWVVNNGGTIYKHNGNSWRSIDGWASDVGYGGGKLWVIGRGETIHRRDGNSWVNPPGSGVRITVQDNGQAWVVDDGGDIYRYSGSNREKLPGSAQDIGAYGNDVVILDRDGKPRSFNWEKGDWDQTEGLNNFPTAANNIDVCSEGNLVVTTKNGDIWAFEKVSEQSYEQVEKS